MPTNVTFEKPRAILLDIEGTTSDISFVSKVLFPFIRNNVGTFIADTYKRDETQELIDRLRKAARGQSSLPQIASSNEPRATIVRTVTEYAERCIAEKRRTPEIKQLELLIWMWGYEKSLLRAHVYDDVTGRMHSWKHHHQISLYVFSSGIVVAQKLLLCYTNHGNCLPLIDDFFDSSLGEKTDPKSFRNISAKIGLPCERILFITDSLREAKAAIDAKCVAVIIRRTGGSGGGASDTVANRRPSPEDEPKFSDSNNNNIPVIGSFADINFKT